MALRTVATSADLIELKSQTDYIETKSSADQINIENVVKEIYKDKLMLNKVVLRRSCLSRKLHTGFLRAALKTLPTGFQSLDASHPWLCYWITHSLGVLGEHVPRDQAGFIAKFLRECQSPDGGFAGGPGQIPHLATTYSAVMALCSLGTEEAYSVIDRPALQRYLLRMHLKSGGFIMHEDGEEDMRGAYCAISVAQLTNVTVPALFDNTGYWISRCQTYEGGFAARPGTEAHGGYGFCGYAALLLIGQQQKIDLTRLIHWAAMRQMRIEGGFQGRTNKLVDSCYAFWVGALFPLIIAQINKESPGQVPTNNLFDRASLQEYLLYCCHYYSGGFTDRPGNSSDYYHTCYSLSGLSLAQHSGTEKCIVGHADNELEVIHPLFGITQVAAESALIYFNALKVPSMDK